jgi:hypothetical protein
MDIGASQSKLEELTYLKKSIVKKRKNKQNGYGRLLW